VPAGNYIARLARHDADLGESYQQTSGWVQGIFDHTQLFTSSGDFKSNAVTEFRKEFTIDSTAGDVDMWGKGNDMFYVFVPYQPGSNAHFRFVEGHVWEDGTTKLPIELVHYYVNKGADNLKRIGSFTDHNGAYFAYTVKDLAFLAEVIFDPAFFQCVANAKLFNTTISNLAGEEDGHFQNVNLTIADHYTAEIAVNNRIVVKGKVVDCDSGLGIPSVGVTLEFGPTFYTDSDGNFTYYAREHWAGRRLGNFYINTGGECLFTGCGCSPVGLIPFDTQGLPCGVNSPRYWPTDLSISLKVLDQNGRGLKTGGHYGISFHLGDLAGRVNYSQNLKYIDIPTFMETGVFTPSQIKWSLKGKLNLPSWAKYIFFARTNNLSANKYLQWVGDKIDFIDNKGNIVMDGNGAIRAKITIKSLLDFNIQSNFNTNVNYQFVQGDIMRVMDDGDNNLFNPANTDGFMDYQVLGTTYNQTIASEQSNQTTITSAVTKDGSGNTTSTTETVSNSNPVNVNDDGVSFIVEFDERLLQLKDKTGFWIELIRPRDISSVESYYEIVGSIPVIGGEPMVTSGTLDTFDTFYQVRSIKIPNALGKSYGHPFESASVTDFFMLGDCSSNGRVNVKDPQASQIWIEDETARTDEIFNAGRVNGLGHCRTKNRKNFKSQTFGGIVAAHADRNRITMICEHDWIIADFDDNQLKVTSQGFVTANMENTISNPYPKEGSYYGCAYEDTATIVFADGMCVWADRHNSAIVALDYHHNQSSVPVGYRNAVDIAAEDMRSYFVNKFNYVLGFNAKLSKADYLANLIELVGGLDPMTGEYNITFRPRMGLKTDPQYFVNNEREIFYDTAETLVYNPDLKKWNGWTGYAPECYGTLSKSSSGVELITFAAGAPWFHNSIGQKSTNVFYGVETEQVIEVALNVANELDKIYQMLYVLSPVVKYFTDRILTQQKNFFSYMPLSHFSRVGKQLHASFKCNMAGYPNPIKPVNSLLMDGDRTTGKVALVRLVADPNNNPEYAELNAIHYRITAEGRTESK
jgi:hypothetical protein